MSGLEGIDGVAGQRLRSFVERIEQVEEEIKGLHEEIKAQDRQLRLLREETARRWAAGAAGPFGRDAAPLPLAEWG